VQLDGPEHTTVKVKPENLVVVDPVEEIDTHFGLAMLTLNGLSYCAPHRMEICGACGVNFRLMNRMAQLGEAPDVCERAERLDREEEKRKQPPLRAPRASRVFEPAPRVPKLNAKVLLEDGFDPSVLPAWPAAASVGKCFEAAFSMREFIHSHAGIKPSPEEDPLYHVKESMGCIGRRYDDCAAVAKPTPRFSLQDEAQTECLMLDVVDVRGVAGDLGKGTPTVVVHYAYYTASNMRKFAKTVQRSLHMKTKVDVRRGFTAAQSAEAGFQNMPSHPAEIALARKLLEKHRKRLSPAFIDQYSQDLAEGWRVSMLQPVSKAAEVRPAPAKQVCAACGQQPATLLTCQRCKAAKYCSQACQKADWAVHKKSCRAPEAEPDAEVIVVNLTPGKQFMPGMPQDFVVATIDSNASVSALKGEEAVVMSQGEAPSKTAHKLFVVKIQVLPGGPGPMGMMCYDEKRKFQLQIHGNNCDEHLRLDARIRAGNVAGGLKAYFSAYVSAGQLHILVHKPLPLQPW